VAGAAGEQLVENGNITSWTGVAAAGLNGYLDNDSSVELNHTISYVAPWVNLAETSIRNNGKLTPTDWATAVGSTLGEAVANNVSGATADTFSGRLENGALRVGTTALVADALTAAVPGTFSGDLQLSNATGLTMEQISTHRAIDKSVCTSRSAHPENRSGFPMRHLVRLPIR
jgi:hypothetical protein